MSVLTAARERLKPGHQNVLCDCWIAEQCTHVSSWPLVCEVFARQFVDGRNAIDFLKPSRAILHHYLSVCHK
eukprot:3601794-Amphidinium_carterae.2